MNDAGEGEPQARRRFFDWRIIPVLAVTCLLMVVLVRELAGTEAFLDAAAGAHAGFVALSFVCLLVGQVFAALRWNLILDALGFRVPLWRAAGAMLATWPLALLAPSRASDLLRAVAIRDLVPPFVGAGSVLAEKAIDVQSLCILALVGAFAHDLPWAAPVAGSLLVVEWVFVIAVLRARDRLVRLPLLRRVPAKVDQVLLAFGSLVRRPGRLAVVTAASLASWTCAMGLLVSLLAAVDAGVGLAPTLALWPAAVLAGMLPVTLAGMGTRDVAFIYLLRATGWEPVREGALLAATFGYSLVGTWVLAIVGIPFGVRFVLRAGRSRGAPESERTGADEARDP